jgi:hypothetical protein
VIRGGWKNGNPVGVNRKPGIIVRMRGGIGKVIARKIRKRKG